MRDYGKVHSSFWSSPTICPLGDDAKFLALYLLTCPHSTIAGVFRLPDGYVAEDLRWAIERVRQAFDELSNSGFANGCETTKWVWIRKHLEWNPPENPNQRKAAAKVAAQVPAECCWRDEFLRQCGPAIGLAPPPAVNGSEGVPKPLPNQNSEAGISEAKASAAVAASASEAVAGMAKCLSAVERIWALGPNLLGEGGRKYLGRLRSRYADDVVAEALEACATERPSDPNGWLEAACRERAARRSKGVAGRVDLTDPNPDWAIAAGFASRFEAENEGCFEHNAAQFAAGRRKEVA